MSNIKRWQTFLDELPKDAPTVGLYEMDRLGVTMQFDYTIDQHLNGKYEVYATFVGAVDRDGNKLAPPEENALFIQDSVDFFERHVQLDVLVGLK